MQTNMDESEVRCILNGNYLLCSIYIRLYSFKLVHAVKIMIFLHHEAIFQWRHLDESLKDPVLF